MAANGSAAFVWLVGIVVPPTVVVVDVDVDVDVPLDDDWLPVLELAVVDVAGAAVDWVAIALIDELNSAVGGIGVASAAGLNEDTPLNGAKKSRLNAAWLRLGLNRNGPSALTLQ